MISATHRNLREHVALRLFREDLFYRINVLDLSLPPLREREGDLAVLIQFFLDGFPRIDGGGQRVLPVLSSEAYAALSAYRFPGNVRELAHAIEHAVVLAGGGGIRARAPAGGDRRDDSGQHSRAPCSRGDERRDSADCSAADRRRS